jgi:hypothetical protein
MPNTIENSWNKATDFASQQKYLIGTLLTAGILASCAPANNESIGEPLTIKTQSSNVFPERLQGPRTVLNASNEIANCDTPTFNNELNIARRVGSVDNTKFWYKISTNEGSVFLRSQKVYNKDGRIQSLISCFKQSKGTEILSIKLEKPVGNFPMVDGIYTKGGESDMSYIAMVAVLHGTINVRLPIYLAKYTTSNETGILVFDCSEKTNKLFSPKFKSPGEHNSYRAWGKINCPDPKANVKVEINYSKGLNDFNPNNFGINIPQNEVNVATPNTINSTYLATQLSSLQTLTKSN